MKSVKEIYETYRKGDPLSDDECVRGRDHFRTLADHCHASGPVFHLAFCEANRVYLALDDFLRARKERR